MPSRRCFTVSWRARQAAPAEAFVPVPKGAVWYHSTFLVRPQLPVRFHLMNAREVELFTSESVTEGHPDKVCDQISDAVLDEVLKQDAGGRVACETLVATGLVVIAGEITTTANLDFQALARRTIHEIGYDDGALRFDWQGCAVLNAVGRQSPDIAMGVDRDGA